MKTVIAVLVMVLGLTGCAMTPAEVRERGTVFQVQSKLAPPALALCATRNAEAQNIQSTTRPGLAAGETEFLMFSTVDGRMNVILTADIQSQNPGSMARVSISPFALSSEKMRETAFKGC